VEVAQGFSVFVDEEAWKQAQSGYLIDANFIEGFCRFAPHNTGPQAPPIVQLERADGSA